MSDSTIPPTGLATIDEYIELAIRDLRNLVGAEIAVEEVAQPLGRNYGRPDPRVAWIQLPLRTHLVRFWRRALVLSDEETRLLRAYADALHEFSRVPRPFATAASEDVLTKAIAVRCTRTERDAVVLEAVMQAIVRYATRTYEGVRVAMNLALDFRDRQLGRQSLNSFLDAPWAPVMGSGLTTAVELSSDGSAQRIIDLPPTDNPNTLAPSNFTSLAEWAGTDDRIGLSVTRSGEVYLFANGELLFARRNSRWKGFPLSLVTQSGWFGTSKRRLAPTMKQAVLSSLLDASAAHHGACIGIVTNDNRNNAVNALLATDDLWGSRANIPSQMFEESSFQALSRRRRLELLSMDGATLLEQSGRIVAAGAIVKVPGGSPGGGRTAAAHAISEYGVGIKVSQDGPVTAHVTEGSEDLIQFSMG